MRLRPRQVQCARALHFGHTARVVHVSAYSFDTEALTWHCIYYESVLILTKSSIEVSERLNAFDYVVALNALYDFVAASPVDYGAAANFDSEIAVYLAAAGSTARSSSAAWFDSNAVGNLIALLLDAVGNLIAHLLRRNPALNQHLPEGVAQLVRAGLGVTLSVTTRPRQEFVKDRGVIRRVRHHKLQTASTD